MTDNNPNIPSIYTGSSFNSIIVYSVTKAPNHGQLVWYTAYPTLWQPGDASWFGQPVTEFTQNDLNNGWFIYKNSSTSGAADGFTFSVSDGFGGTIGPTTSTIPVQPVNPIVVEIDAGMFVTTGGVSKFAADWLRVVDNAPGLTFTLTQTPSHGTLLLGGQPVSSFGPSDLYSLSYQQDGGPAQSDQFAFNVSDAYGNSIPNLIVPVTIGANAFDKNTGALVDIGQSVVINGENLHVNDPGMGSGNPDADTPTSLVYTLTSIPVHGTLVSTARRFNLATRLHRTSSTRVFSPMPRTDLPRHGTHLDSRLLMYSFIMILDQVPST